MLRNWRFWTGVGVGAIVAILAIALVGVALAQGPEPGTPPARPGAGFVDEDRDGICDNCGTGQGRGYLQRGRMGGRSFADENGDGICDNFVDENGDGVCDLRGTGHGMGRSAGFVDEDGDGVCDHFAAGGRMGPGRGAGRSRGGGWQ